MRQPEWDRDYRRGQQGELFLDEIVRGMRDGTVEVKTDDRAVDTGNLYIETECLRQGEYKPSGLATTKAQVWLFVVGGFSITVPTVHLRRWEQRSRKASCDVGSHPTRGFVLPLNQLIAWERAITLELRRHA
jgi:hypothetical protein